MTSQKTLAMALALCAAVVQADNCGKWRMENSLSKLDYETHEFKAGDLTTMKCSSHETTMASCFTECCKEKDICHNWPVTCDAGKAFAVSKGATATTSAMKKTDCCVAEAECKAHSCGTGWKAKANKDTIKCNAETCDDSQCCDLVAETCSGHVAAGHGCAQRSEHSDEYEYDSAQAATALPLVQLAMFTTTCCKKKLTCEGQAALSTGCGGGNSFYDVKSQGSTAVTSLGDWKDVCCKAADKCKSLTCTAGDGWLADTTKEETLCDADGCTEALCCKPDPTKCRGFSHSVHAPCETDDADASSTQEKANLAVADAAEYKRVCCSPKSTCQQAKDLKFTKGSAGGSPHQHEPAMVLFLAAIGALALRM